MLKRFLTFNKPNYLHLQKAQATYPETFLFNHKINTII